MVSPSRSESGQVILLVVLALIGLLAFTALAIDGGMVYSDHRNAQNAADASALAGALALANNQIDQIVPQALARAETNDFNNDQVNNWVNVYYPPMDGTYQGDPHYVQVKIRSRSNTSLIHLIYKGLAENQVEAVARVLDSQTMGGATILYGMSLNKCKTLEFDGTGDVSVENGNIFSNSKANNHPSCESAVQGGSGTIDVQGGDIQIVGSFNINGNAGSVTPNPLTGVAQEEPLTVPPPKCPDTSSGDVHLTNNNSLQLDPGRYGSIDVQGGNLTLNSGLFCIEGDFTSNGGSVKSVSPGVMIYMMGGSSSGKFALAGNTQVDLQAHTKDWILDTQVENPAKLDYGGMLLYMDPLNPNSATILGASSSSFIGTVFSPSGQCVIGGNSQNITGDPEIQLNISSQIICDTIKTAGNPKLNMVYQASDNFQPSAQISLVH